MIDEEAALSPAFERRSADLSNWTGSFDVNCRVCDMTRRLDDNARPPSEDGGSFSGGRYGAKRLSRGTSSLRLLAGSHVFASRRLGKPSDGAGVALFVPTEDIRERFIEIDFSFGPNIYKGVVDEEGLSGYCFFLVTGCHQKLTDSLGCVDVMSHKYAGSLRQYRPNR